MEYECESMKKTIETVPEHICTGCGACFNKCPKNAIVMEYNSEGFLFPKVTESCIECGACLKVCPALNPVDFHETPDSFAVWAEDSIRLKSSSGGMFSLLAEEIFKQNGVVCGAAYADDYRTVHHAWAETREELSPLRGSKYVQSDTNMTYREAEKYLNSGRPVLYTGCPCQIAGLYRYLGRSYDHLYTADLVCHGSNSVTAYQSFIEEFSEGKEIERVDFHDKTFFPWSTPTVVFFKDGTVKKCAFNEGTWYKGFLEGIINRKNCYECRYARAERIADITLADCWQVSKIDPKLDDRQGTSLVLVNSEKGTSLFKSCKSSMKLCRKVPLDEVRKFNGQLNRPTPQHPSRKFFFEHLPKDGYHKALWYGRGMRFDVGLVGWWFASNYGSCLTYYALGCFLEKVGKQAILIKLPTLSGAPWDADTQISIRFLSQYFKISADRSMNRLSEVNHFCDMFMLGSDQMWREDSIRLVGYSFFLDFVENNKKKIAFSTSFGNEHFTDNKETREIVADLLQRFDAISVREKSGIDVCKKEFGVNAQQLLDPVFLCERKDYDRLTKKVQDHIPPKYLLCYILDPSSEKEQAALEIARHEGLEILTILGMKEYENAINRWKTGTILPKITPEQFIYYIKNCTFLLTDSHHGTCFGIIYHKQYIALVNKNRGATRFETVAETLGLQNRLLFDTNKLAQREDMYYRIDYETVKKRLMPEKERAKRWLTNAFDAPVKQREHSLATAIIDSRRRDKELMLEIQLLKQKQSKQEQQIREMQHKISELNQKEEKHSLYEWIQHMQNYLRRVEKLKHK